VIPELPPAYVKHLVEPRHQRDLPDSQAAGERGSMVGGMGVRVTLTYREGPEGTPVLRDAGARVFGSAAPLAPASALMELVRGLAPEQALAIGVEGVLACLGARRPDVLPPAVSRGTEFVLHALRAALGGPGERPADPRGPGILVCRCLGVGDRQIRAAIRHGARTPEEIGAEVRASTGCRSCRPDLLVLLYEERRAVPPPPPRDRHPVERIALARVGPLLAAYGVALHDASVTGETVVLRLGAVAPGAAVSPRGAQEVARHLLRETVWEGVRVAVSGVA
jgi:bacterioferritin-associated ferredoxin/NifU-like protein involved in Fe-S cluster formation